MKLFTVEEANALLPVVRPKLEAIKSLYAETGALRPAVKAAAEAGVAAGGGGLTGGTGYVKSLYRIGKLTTELGALGVELKDYARGLIDFPTMRGGRVVLLCWQLGEPDCIEWWHERETGFAGRKPL